MNQPSDIAFATELRIECNYPDKGKTWITPSATRGEYDTPPTSTPKGLNPLRGYKERLGI